MVEGEDADTTHVISVVIPVYRGEKTLDSLLAKISPLTSASRTPADRVMRVSEVILVHDHGPDASAEVIRRLASEMPFVHPVWLSRNFGQHAATIAGMSSSGSEWIVTLDEDGQFNPADIGKLLDVAINENADLVYGKSTNAPPHGRLRNYSSLLAKGIASRLLSNGSSLKFSSFRLMLGEVGRGVAAYVGPDVYLDIALTWAFNSIEVCPVTFHEGVGRPSGYSFRKLLKHFWQMVLASGPRPLRFVSLGGCLVSLAGLVLAVVVLVEKITGTIKVTGWTSLAVILLILGGFILISLGIIAEYIGVAVRMAMGQPLYLIVSDPLDSPLIRKKGQQSNILHGD